MILALVAMLGSERPAFAHHDETVHCHLPNAVQALRLMVRSATDGTGFTDPLVQAAIADTLPRFDAARMPTGADTLPALSQLRDAAVLLASGSRADLRAARTQYEAFEAALKPYCIRQTRLLTGIRADDPRFIAAPIEEDEDAQGQPVRTVEVAKMASRIFLIMLGLIAVIIGTDRAYAAWNAYKFSRKKCRVYTQMVVDDFSAYGHLTILGLRGFRFIPEDPAFNADVPRLARMGEAYLRTAGLIIPSELRNADEDGIVGTFEMPLSMAQHRRILAMSTRTPVFFPAGRLPARNIAPFETGKPKRRAYQATQTPELPTQDALS